MSKKYILFCVYLKNYLKLFHQIKSNFPPMSISFIIEIGNYHSLNTLNTHNFRKEYFTKYFYV